MKQIRWDPKKNEWLRRERAISFEDVEYAIENGRILDILEHPNILKYSNQKIFVVEIKDYAYLVPFVENDDEIFFKTIIPNREATKKYLGRSKHEKT